MALVAGNARALSTDCRSIFHFVVFAAARRMQTLSDEMRRYALACTCIVCVMCVLCAMKRTFRSADVRHDCVIEMRWQIDQTGTCLCVCVGLLLNRMNVKQFNFVSLRERVFGQLN